MYIPNKNSNRTLQNGTITGDIKNITFFSEYSICQNIMYVNIITTLKASLWVCPYPCKTMISL